MSWEVWTMKSKTSFFDWNLLKKNITRFAPAWGILLVMLLLAFPVSALREVKEYWGVQSYLSTLREAGPLISAFSALLFASILFRYLHNARAAYMMHAFPMTRTCLFVTNLVSGLLFFLAPVLVTALANQIVFLVNGVSALNLGWVGRWCLEYLFFYGLAVFCMFLSGSQFISGLSYAALNFVCLLIPLVFFALARWFVYGLNSSTPDWLMYLSPLVTMIADEYTIVPLGIYAGIGVVLMGLAWLFYQKRHVERAGDAMVFPWAEQLFRLVFTFCVGLYLGMGFASIHADYFLPISMIGLFIGWFGATMVLRRTAKVFKLKKVWLGYGLFVLALLLTVGAMWYDVLGWQRRIPDADEVVSVKIWSYDPYREGHTDNALYSDLIVLTEPDQIESVRQLHSGFLAKRENRIGAGNALYDGMMDEFHIEYQLADGTTLHRCYGQITEVDYERIDQLYTDGRVAGPWYEERLPKQIDFGWIDIYNGYDYENTKYSCFDGNALRAALVADAAAGRLPVQTYYVRFGYKSKYDDVEMLTLMINSSGSDMTSLRIPTTATETLKLFDLPEE